MFVRLFGGGRLIACVCDVKTVIEMYKYHCNTSVHVRRLPCMQTHDKPYSEAAEARSRSSSYTVTDVSLTSV